MSTLPIFSRIEELTYLLLMIRDLTHGMKETRQGTMALVQVHVDLLTTIQRPNESVETYYKIFCARRDTVNAHGGEAGYHEKLYAKARVRVMDERGRRETWMTTASGTARVRREEGNREAGEESLLRSVPRGIVHPDVRQRAVLGP